MPDNKIPYTQCLLHTGKKVYKYWLATLAIIGVIIGLVWIIASEWKQIIDFTNGVGNVINSIGYVLSTTFGTALTLVSSIPWYLWVIAGITVGPFILVAIYCAAKRYGVEKGDVIIFVASIITIASLYGPYNMFYNLICLHGIGILELVIDVICCIWLYMVISVLLNLFGVER